MVVALLTDFGTQDYFVAAMKGVILTLNPDATIVDITHEIPPQDIGSAAFVLRSCYKEFPHNTIFLCVVDPGVGSERRAIIVETENYKFVAPDNGLLDLVLSETERFKAFSITNTKYLRENISNTFHGRDIFAPAAGHLSRDIAPSQFGEPVSLEIKEWGMDAEGPAGFPTEARIIYIDHFGNLVTNIRNDVLPDNVEMEINGKQISKVYSFYAQAKSGELFFLRGSAGLVEISLRDGSAQAELEIKRGAQLKIKHKHVL